MSWKRAWTLRPPVPVNAPCPRRSLCWRREPSQERGQFQTKPASQRRDWCLRKPLSSRRPRAPRHSRPQAGPWPQRVPWPGSTQPQRSARPAPGGSGVLGVLGLRWSLSPWRGLCPGLAASRPSLCRCAVPPASLSSWCLWLPPCLLSSSLQASPSCVSSPCLLCCPQDRGLGCGLTWHPHHTLIPDPDSREASDACRRPPPRKPCPLAWPWACGCTPTAEAVGGSRGLACCHRGCWGEPACGGSRLPVLPRDSPPALSR